MKNNLKIWGFYFLLIVMVACISLAVIIINPTLLYSRESVYKNYTIYHDQPLNVWLIVRLDRAADQLQGSEINDSEFNYTLCLNDGSLYPKIISFLFSDSFAWSFNHFIILNGEIDFEKNFAKLKSKKWNLTQLIAHEAVHCQQYNTFGICKSNPIANIPDWKWEGYPEYISRRKSDSNELLSNLKKLILVSKDKSKNWIKLEDGSETTLDNFKSRLLVQFCMEIKKLSFIQLIHNRETKEEVNKEMLSWYSLTANH